MMVCATYTGARDSTDMVILEVEMMSGHVAVNPDYLVNEINSGVERVEVDEKVLLLFRYIFSTFFIAFNFFHLIFNIFLQQILYSFLFIGGHAIITE